jgi:hypothetical protein
MASRAVGLEVTSADGSRIRYQPDSEGIMRTVHRDGVLIHRDAFRLTRYTGARWEIQTNDNRTIVTLVVSTAGDFGQDEHFVSEHRFDAIVNLHRISARDGESL